MSTSGAIKQFKASVDAGKIKWMDDYDLDEHSGYDTLGAESRYNQGMHHDDSVFSEPFRCPASAVLDLVRQNIHLLHTDVLSFPAARDSEAHGDDEISFDESGMEVFKRIAHRIDWGDRKNMARAMRVHTSNGTSTTNGTDELTGRYQIPLHHSTETKKCIDDQFDPAVQRLERTIGRHVEGVIDAVLHMTFSFFEPIAKLANAKETETPGGHQGPRRGDTEGTYADSDQLDGDVKLKARSSAPSHTAPSSASSIAKTKITDTSKTISHEGDATAGLKDTLSSSPQGKEGKVRKPRAKRLSYTQARTHPAPSIHTQTLNHEHTEYHPRTRNYSVHLPDGRVIKTAHPSLLPTVLAPPEEPVTEHGKRCYVPETSFVYMLKPCSEWQCRFQWTAHSVPSDTEAAQRSFFGIPGTGTSLC
jgi:hypothetical protein